MHYNGEIFVGCGVLQILSEAYKLCVVSIFIRNNFNIVVCSMENEVCCSNLYVKYFDREVL